MVRQYRRRVLTEEQKLANLQKKRRSLEKARLAKRVLKNARSDIVKLLTGELESVVIETTIAKPITLLNTIYNAIGGSRISVKLSSGGYFTFSQRNRERIYELIQGNITAASTLTSDEEFMNDFFGDGTIELVAWRQSAFQIVDFDELREEREGGGFFKYKHNLNANFERYGIFKEVKAENIRGTNCLIRALQNGGLAEYKVNQLKCCVVNREIQLHKLHEVAKKLKIQIQVNIDSKIHYYGDKQSKEIYKLGLLVRHYFLIERTNLTSYSIDNYNEVKDLPNWNQIYMKSEGRYKRSTSKFIDSLKVVKLLLENKDTLLTEISQVDKEILETPYYMEIDNIANLEYDPETNSKPTEYREPNEQIIKPELVFFDFETYVKNTTHKCSHCILKTTKKACKNDNNGEHIPYICRAVKEDGTALRCFEGPDCGKQLLDSLTQNSHMIAHNASFDVQFLAKYLFNIKVIEKGHNLYCMDARYNNIKIKITDSLKMIPEALRKFAKMFNLSGIQKELMNYNIYTADSIRKRYMSIEEVKKTFEDKNDQKQFLANIKKWNLQIDDKFDIVKYSSEYCLIDCEVLRLGYLMFRDWMIEITGIDIGDCLTIASLADKFLIKAGCYEGVNQFSGVVREFIQKCVVGGRVMTANNKQIVREECISDFDAVSLYPSAMERLARELGGFLKGNPKVIEEEQKNINFLEQQDGYFINISIDKVNRKLTFPLISVVHSETGVREFTNLATGNYYIDKIAFEDLIKFQEIEYTIKRGYYFNEGRNNTVGTIIKDLFNERLKKKKEGNSIQVVYKLIMNSSYGKSIMKAVDSETRVFNNAKDMFKYTNYNYNIVKGFIKMNGCNKWKVESIKTINEHFSRPHVGVEILSMSKRIMNEVMVLAEDLELPIFYQDTDSMHIGTNNIEILSKAFEEKYERKLIGSGMGQFHSDFEMNGVKVDAGTQIIATKSIFLGKKTYIDRLEGIVNGKVVIDYHIRMKGVPNASIHHCVKVEELDSPMELYENLLNGGSYKFDLLCGGERVNFKYNKNMTVKSLSEFSRDITFNDEQRALNKIKRKLNK